MKGNGCPTLLPLHVNPLKLYDGNIEPFEYMINSSNVISVAAFDKANSVTGGANTLNTAPSSPTDGQLWWNSEYGRLFVYYNDGDSSQWVDANPATDYRPIWTSANAAFDNSNAAFNTANAAYNNANAAYNNANAAYNAANTTQTLTVAAFDTANNAATTGKAIAMAIVFGG